MSAPIPPAQTADAPKLIGRCRECGYAWYSNASKHKDYRRVKAREQPEEPADGTAVEPVYEVICRDDRGCRARKLTITLDLGLFARLPREEIYSRMDPRPANWKSAGWLARGTTDESVLACIQYCSWCYPVCLPFAVLIDAEDENIQRDRYGEPVPLRERDIARILNQHQPNVNRAVKRLIRRKRLRVDEDGVYYPIAKPDGMTVAERQALYLDTLAAAVQELGEDAKTFRGLPRRFRQMLLDRIGDMAPGIRTEILQQVRAECTSFNDGLRRLRTQRDGALQKLCTPDTILIPQSSNTSTERACGAGAAEIPDARTQGSGPTKGGGQAEYLPAGGGEHGAGQHKAERRKTAERLYAAIPGWQDQYPGTPFALQRFTLGKADRILVYRIIEKLGDAPGEAFVPYVDRRLHARPPRDYGLGMLVNFADDYRLDYLQAQEQVRNSVHKPTEQELAEAEAENQRFDAEQQAVLDDPNASEDDKQFARLYLGSSSEVG